MFLFSLSETRNVIYFNVVSVYNTPFEISWLKLYAAEMEFVSWSYITIWYLEAAPSKNLPVGNMIVYFGKRKVVVVMSYLC